MSARTIALQLRTLAADPDSQGLLLQEASCLSGLVALLHADNDEDVLILSLQALAFLAANPAHHAALVNQPGLILALSSLTEKTAVVLKTLAQNVIAALEGYINGGGNSNSASSNSNGSGTMTPGSARGRTPLTGSSRGGSRGNTRPTTPSTGGRESSGSIGGGGGASSVSAAHNFVPRYLQHIVFQITPSTAGGAALDKAGQMEIEKSLVAIKGVVSVAYSSSSSTVGVKSTPTFTLYTSLKPAVLQPLVVRAIADFSTRAGVGREVTVTMVSKDKSAPQQESDKENQENTQQSQTAATPATTSSAPGYLQKSTAAGGAPGYLKKSTTAAVTAAPAASSSGYLTSSSSSSASGSAGSAAGGSRALAAHATASSSSDSASNLAARYQSQAAKKKADQAAAAAAAATPKKAGLLSSVTSYFW